MLPSLGKAIGLTAIVIAIALLYFAVVACVNLLHDAVGSDEPPPSIHPQLQPYMPEKLGNDPEHPVARLLDIDKCHTENWVPGTPEITFQVQRIINGDTILAHTSEQPEQRLRLWGIDAPESDQPHGTEATARLQGLVPTGKMVKARNMGLDKYERILVIIGEENELPVNWTMVMTDNAHHYDFGDSAGDLCLKSMEPDRGMERLAGPTRVPLLWDLEGCTARLAETATGPHLRQLSERSPVFADMSALVESSAAGAGSFHAGKRHPECMSG